MRHILILMMLLGFTCSLESAFGASFYVEKAKATGLAEDDAATLGELIRTEIPKIAGQTVASRAGEADFLLKPKVMRLGKSYLVVLEKTDRSGNPKYSSQLKAAELEEFDKVAARLVRAVLLEKAASEDANVGEVTQNEAKSSTERRDTNKFWQLGFGPFGLAGLQSQGIAYGVLIGYDWDIENNAAVKIFWNGVFSTNKASFNDIGLGGSYFFSEKATSPLVSVDLGYGVGHSSTGDEAGGFAVGVGPAIRFFRTSKINVEVQARFEILLRTVDGMTPIAAGIHAVLMF